MITDKIGPHHLERKAILYVRQSSAHQVLHNRESGALQYAMRDRLKKRIVRTLIQEVVADIDDDASKIVLIVHWTGGVHSEICLPKRRRGQRNSTANSISSRSTPASRRRRAAACA